MYIYFSDTLISLTVKAVILFHSVKSCKLSTII